LLKAYADASQMPLKLASFFAATWDYTLYSEGFLAPFAANAGLTDTVSSFISIDELIDHPVLDPKLISIKDYVKAIVENKPLKAGNLTPFILADSLEKGANNVLSIIMSLHAGASPTLVCELDDLATWANLSRYFADKLRAGVALQQYRLTGDKTKQQQAISLLKN